MRSVWSCGFGAGIILMIALPFYYPLSQAAGVSCIMNIALIAAMVYRYRKHINLRKVILPLLLYSTVATAAIRLAPYVDQALLKRCFGGFLILLALYHFFLHGKDHGKWNVWVSAAAIIFSGVCSGLFAVGGPLMAVYYLANTDSKEEYLATIETLFLLNNIWSSYVRIRNGIVTSADLPVILFGSVFILLGFLIANRVVDKLDDRRMVFAVYTAVGNYLVSIPMLLWGKIPVWTLWVILIAICLVSAAFIFSIMKKLEAATQDTPAPAADALETVEDDAI